METASLHGEVDRAYSELDLRHAQDLGLFLNANLAALSAIGLEPGPDAQVAALHRDAMIAALQADLEWLGATPLPRPSAARFDPTAVLYVLLGSRLGTQVLRRRWLESSDPFALGASRYFGLPAQTAQWRDLCRRMSEVAAQGPGTDAILRDAQRLFSLYHASLRSTRFSRHEGPGP